MSELDIRLNLAGGAMVEEDAGIQPEVHPNHCEWPMDSGSYICPRESAGFIRFPKDTYWIPVCSVHLNGFTLDKDLTGGKSAPKCKTCGTKPALDGPLCWTCWSAAKDARRRAAR